MILALKTASMETELALLNSDGSKIGQTEWQSGRELSEQLLSKIEALLTSHNLGFNDLTGIVAFEGPGSFTSLRIGLTVANTIAYAQAIPIVGAAGQNWLKDGLNKLKSAKPGHYIMPHYGAEANITKPKK